MGRIAITAAASGSGKKETARERRIRQSMEAVKAAEPAPARRGESDTDEPEPPAAKNQVAPDVPHQVEAPVTHTVTPALGDITLSGETPSGFEYIPIPEGADPLDQIAHIKRGIHRANAALSQGMGKLERDYVLCAGAYLWDATTTKSYKAANFKSVETFAKSLGLERHDVYRLRKALPVYRAVGHLVDEPLSMRVIEELYKSEEGMRQEVFQEMKRTGRITPAGAVAARRLLAAGDATEIIESDPQSTPKSEPVEELAKAWKARRVVDLDLLRQAKESNPDAAQAYVNDLREQYEAALKVIEG